MSSPNPSKPNPSKPNPSAPNPSAPKPSTRPQARPNPNQQSPAGSAKRPSKSAYPNNITFHALIKKNKQQSVLLIAAMILLALVFGGLAGGVIGPTVWGIQDATRAVGNIYDSALNEAADPNSNGEIFKTEDLAGVSSPPLRLFGLDLSAFTQSPILLPSMLVGAGIMGLLAGAGAGWSYFAGSDAILRMSRAHPITKQLDAELFNVTEEMAIAAGIPMPRIYLIGDSAMNAFACGRDPAHGAVAITTGLRAKLNRDELQAVIAHEIAHIRHYDIRFSMLMATMVGLLVVASDAFLQGIWYGRGAVAAGTSRARNMKVPAPLLIVMIIAAVILAIVTPFLARLIQMTYSREREYLADAGAVELTRNPRGLASALSKLATDPDPLVDTANRGVAHMYIVSPLKKMHDSHQSLNSLFCSHPPLKRRLQRILALLK